MDQAYRATSITSSDAKDIIAGNYLHLYKLKTGEIEFPDLSDNFPVQLGLYTEPFHLNWISRKLKDEYTDVKWSKGVGADDQHEATYLHKEVSTGKVAKLISHPDALINLSGTTFPVEVKHTGRFTKAEDCANHYMPQIQHHMICWGIDKLLFSAICNNAEPERIWIGASIDWQEHYLTRCETFWGYLDDKIPPPPSNYESDHRVVMPKPIQDSVPLDNMTRRDISKDNRAQALIPEFITTKAAAKRHDEIKKELKDMVGPTERELYSPQLTMKRDARGAIRFTVKDD
jgi:hypothetical protein